MCGTGVLSISKFYGGSFFLSTDPRRPQQTSAEGRQARIERRREALSRAACCMIVGEMSNKSYRAYPTLIQELRRAQKEPEEEEVGPRAELLNSLLSR